jgi:sugar phosphate isomerase/epimerase
VLGPEDLVLCCGTVQRADFRELVEAAAGAGFRGISLQPHLYHRARKAGLSDADMRHLLDDHGVEIAELDALASWLPGGPDLAGLPEGMVRGMLSTTAEDFFRIADAVGGRSLNAGQLFPGPFDADDASEALAAVCEGAAGCGLLVSLEFFPWSDISDPGIALRIVEGTGHANAGLMVDSWHIFRGVGDVAALEAVPGERVVGVQLNDAPAQPAPVILKETLEGRLLPGEGDIDLVALVRTLDAIGSRAPLGAEVYSSELAARPPRESAGRAADAMRKLVARARA